MSFDEFKKRFPSAVEHELMSRHTSFRIGGPARLYVTVPTSDELVRAVTAALELAIPFYIFGGGSNLLVADGGYGGLVIQAANRGMVLDDGSVRAESGAITALVSRKSVDAGLTGFEWAVGVPGTIGGAVYGNAGCFGGEMKDVIVSVDAFRLRDRQRVRVTNAECRYGYRESMFKHEPHVILGCEMGLVRSEGDHKGSPLRLDEILQKRKSSQPLDGSSCGCVFKNFEYQDESALDLLKRRVDEIPSSMLAAKRLSAGWLIDRADLTGRRIGGIEVSGKHGNFFLNKGQARAQDVIALISLVKMKVRDELGIELQEEVQMLGF